ncbi:MAG: 16S rRNA (uracil(1498)-N(3))-methyltransferase [Muribaculaceae bacterium]
MHRFYAPDIAETLTLPEVESGHCVRVLRLREGDLIEVVDGMGNCYVCSIAVAHHKRCAVNIVSTAAVPCHWGKRIDIAIAPTKNLDRMEWMSEKCTEMGVDSIIPLRCRYSERKELKTERINKILVSAMKQSLKCTLPQLSEMTAVADVIAMPYEGKRYIAYCDENIPRRLFAQEYDSTKNALIMIGPEGDFSPEEIEMALNAGFVPVSLGDSRLRTESAAVMACAMCHTVKQMRMAPAASTNGKEQ